MANDVSKDDQKAMDVSKPGKVAADASARPVIVSHRPMIQDPMVKPEEISEFETTTKTGNEPKSAPTSGEKVVKPLKDSPENSVSENKKTTSEADSANDKGQDKPLVVEKDPSTTSDEASTNSEETKKSADTKVSAESSKTIANAENDDKAAKNDKKKTDATSDVAEMDAVINQAPSAKKKNEEDAEQETAKREHYQKLIDEKKYFVKTGQVARRRNNRIALVSLVLLIVLIGLYIAIDAKILKVGFDVPFQLIKN